MVKRPAPPSASAPRSDASPRPPRTSAPRRRVDVREWTGGIRLSAFAVIMLSLVVLGAWVLVPTLGVYLDQRQKIAALEQAVAVSEAEIIELQRERERWQDPAYITTQARERLYYVRPGETVYLVDNDLDTADLPQPYVPVSEEIQVREADWMPQLLRSLTAAGLARTAVPAD